MKDQTAHRRLSHPAAGRAASERRTEALVAAYIHDLSPRHRAEREARLRVR
jgi:hypothetical protein